MCPYLNLFGLTIPVFGLMMSLGMLVGIGLLLYTRKFRGFTEDDAMSAALWAILCGLLGAKLLYWITELDAIIQNPKVFLSMLTQGFVFYGSLIGGVAGLAIFCRRNRKSFFAMADLFMPSLVLGQALGRIGCFCAGCCYGAPTDSAWSVVYPAGTSAPAGVPLIPTQLYESAFLFVLAAVLVVLMKKDRRDGVVFGWYAVLYGVWRFIIEFYRSDDRGFVGSLSTSQFIGIFVILLGILVLVLVKKGRTVSRETSAEEAPEAAEAEASEEEADEAEMPSEKAEEVADEAAEETSVKTEATEEASEDITEK